jgi:predicted TIM-barrel fold metal-dependent hydrolase
MVVGPEIASARKASDRGRGVVDCDVHTQLRSESELKKFLAKRWHVYYDQLPRRALPEMGLRPAPHFYRHDAFPDAGPPGSDIDVMREQLLDRYDVRKAILAPFEIARFPQQGEFAAALFAAINDVTTEWLERDSRLFGAITIPFEDPVASVREIERMIVDPRFVCVLITVATREPLGDAKYWPMYEAAVHYGLPVAVHVSGWSGTEGAAGWPTYHVERHGTWPQAFAAQVVSLVCGSVFDRYPRLQVVLEEAGLAWIPPLMWRLDRAWEEMRTDVPHLKKRPSDVIREHFWVTTQPLDEPSRPSELREMLDQLAMDARILFATDYPHWDFDDPTRVLAASTVGRERRERILALNAELAYRFPPQEQGQS